MLASRLRDLLPEMSDVEAMEICFGGLVNATRDQSIQLEAKAFSISSSSPVRWPRW